MIPLVGGEYLNDEVVYKNVDGISASLGFGEIQKTGRILLNKMLDDMQRYFIKRSNLVIDVFDHGQMKIGKDSISYKHIKSKKIVFCEGFGVKVNPYFNGLPLIGSKGQWIKIRCKGLRLNKIIKAGIFIFQVGKEIFFVGSTFDTQDKTTDITSSARQGLVKKLKRILTYPFEVVQQGAGIRPTVLDRRPLLGKHSKYGNVCIFNGLGTRGVMIAPQMAIKLYETP